MREIKFRAWNANEKKMITPACWINECNLISSQLGSAPTHPVMQYTGLKDKDGKPIYEGDVVRIVALDDKGYSHLMTGVVEFEDFEYCVTTNDAFWPCVSWKCVDFAEVIGNIHENPELLEV